MYPTVKQFEILFVVASRNADKTYVDLDQLLERLSYETTKASLQFSIRSLIRQGLIEKKFEKRRGRNHVTYVPTELALVALGRKTPQSDGLMVVDEELDAILSEADALVG